MNVLAVGAHPDDIEIGCGGALLRHRDRGDSITMVVLSSGEREEALSGTRRREQERAAQVLGAELIWAGYDGGHIPTSPDAVELVEDAANAFDAKLVYLHNQNDLHQEHQKTASVTLAACRRVEGLLMYQGPGSNGFDPKVFVNIGDQIDEKISLLACHASQVETGKLDPDAVKITAAYWGMICRTSAAEGFEPVRFRWEITQ